MYDAIRNENVTVDFFPQMTLHDVPKMFQIGVMEITLTLLWSFPNLNLEVTLIVVKNHDRILSVQDRLVSAFDPHSQSLKRWLICQQTQYNPNTLSFPLIQNVQLIQK